MYMDLLEKLELGGWNEMELAEGQNNMFTMNVC